LSLSAVDAIGCTITSSWIWTALHLI
jgi:hypothetical protein